MPHCAGDTLWGCARGYQRSVVVSGAEPVMARGRATSTRERSVALALLQPSAFSQEDSPGTDCAEFLAPASLHLHSLLCGVVALRPAWFSLHSIGLGFFLSSGRRSCPLVD